MWAVATTSRRLMEVPGGVEYLEEQRVAIVHPDENNEKLKAQLNYVTQMTQLQKLHILGAKKDCLKELPDGICKLGGLEELEISGCWNLQLLPESIGALSQLRVLKLSSCKSLKSLPDSLGDLVALTTLTLNSLGEIVELPSSIGRLIQLKQLDISYFLKSGLKELPKEICGLKGLEELKVRGCFDLELLPESIGALSRLRALQICDCGSLKSLPDGISDLVALTTLSLQFFKEFVTLPSIRRLTQLKELQLAVFQGGLNELPDDLGKLEQLEELRLRECRQLELLPESLGTLSRLRVLTIGYCKSLKSLPNSLGDLVVLTRLSLHCLAGVAELPTSIGRLTQLKELSLVDSIYKGFKRLPDEIGKLKELEELNVRGHRDLQLLPESIGALSRLRALTISNCRSLKSLPDSIGDLVALTRLSLDCLDKVEELPSSIGSLTRLKQLNLSHFGGKLDGLPTSMRNLTSLEELSLCACTRLTVLPQFIYELPSLKKMHLVEFRSSAQGHPDEIEGHQKDGQKDQDAAQGPVFSSELRLSGGEVLASGQNVTDGDIAGNLFDGRLDTVWVDPGSAEHGGKAWVEYIIPDDRQAVIVDKYDIVVSNDWDSYEGDPAAWRLEGLKEGEEGLQDTWTTLDEQIKADFQMPNSLLRFYLPKPSFPCRRLRLVITGTRKSGYSARLSCWNLYRAESADLLETAAGCVA